MVDLKVWGEYACFTRPEFKVERVSYPVMTPSAARGILEAIYWKPQMRYRIVKIGIIKLGTQTSLLRNEISARQSEPPKKRRAREHFLVAEDCRQQRTSLILQDVEYRIVARIETRPGENNLAKHLDCFRRRAECGSYHHKPWFGCREFAVEFQPAESPQDDPKPLELPVGQMLFDTAYIADSQERKDKLEFWSHAADGKKQVVKGHAERLFFEASVCNGWLEIPQNKYTELDRMERRNGTA